MLLKMMRTSGIFEGVLTMTNRSNRLEPVAHARAPTAARSLAERTEDVDEPGENVHDPEPNKEEGSDEEGTGPSAGSDESMREDSDGEWVRLDVGTPDESPPWKYVASNEVEYEVTLRGETRRGKTTAKAVRRGRDCVERHADQIREEPGRFGLNYNFIDFGNAKAANMVRSASEKWGDKQRWGFKHNRWDSENADFYIVAVHLLRAAKYRNNAPDCEHDDHKAGHVCEAFRILDSPIPPPPTNDPAPAGTANPDPALIGKDGVEAPSLAPEVPAKALPSEQRNRRTKARSWTSTDAKPGSDAAHPILPAIGFRSVNDAVRELGALHDPQTPRIVHIHQTADAMDIMVLTAPQGNEALSFFEARLRHLTRSGGWDPERQVSPKDWINVTRLADFFAHDIGATGAACTDALKNLGPWKPEEFSRDMADFGKWQEAWHDCLRGGLLKYELERRGLNFAKCTETSPNGKPRASRNAYGEDFWRVEAIQ